MEILTDEALVLNRKYYNEANILLTLFTKKYGKIMVLSYGVRKSKKKELYSLSPTNYIEIQLNKRLNNITLKEHRLIKIYKNLHSNIYKLELGLYIIYVLDKVLLYNQSEIELYCIVENIYNYLENIDDKILNKEYILKFIFHYLKRITIELGIYSSDIAKNEKNIESKIKRYEEYICSYFNIEMNYREIIRSGLNEKSN